MTNAKVNFNFEESYLGEKQITVKNTLGRVVEHLELAILDGYFGECCEFNDIANNAYGKLNIESDREIRTNQINVTDTFTIGSVVYFLSGGSVAAGQLRSTAEQGSVAVGVCTFINVGIAIGFRPFVQRLSEPNALDIAEAAIESADIVHVTTIDIDDDAHTAALNISNKIPVGKRIIDVIAKSTATVTDATVQLRTNAVSPAAISNAIDVDTIKVVSRAGTLENDVVTADGLQLITASAADRCLVTILWR